MNRFLFSTGAALLLGISAVANAQENIGELQAKGGKQLSGPELRELLIGATTNGRTTTGYSNEITIKPDGTASGKFFGIGRTANIGLSGTWNIADDGKMCVKYDFDGPIPSYQGCGYYYTADGQYFISLSESRKDSDKLLQRTVKR